MIIFLVILFRWLHIISACLVLGGAMVMRFVLPVGLRKLDADAAEDVLLACRRVFKMMVHTAILLLLVSGVFNTMRNWSTYGTAPLAQSLWGTHVLLAAIAITIAIYVLMGKKPPAKHQLLLAINVGVLLATILLASSLKWWRDSHATAAAQTPAAVQP
jgi:uncharacterized membrane protein